MTPALHIEDVDAPERLKYDEMWEVPEYRDFSPGMENVDRFMKVMEPSPLSTVIDVGCGAGVAGLEFERRGLRATWLDITDSALDEAVDRERFIRAPLWSGGWPLKRRHGWDYAFCCDVMEHIPVEYTMLCVERIVRAARLSWFQIAFLPDQFGQMIGKPLHLTVMPFEWWLSRLASVGKVEDARDLCGSGMFVVSR